MEIKRWTNKFFLSFIRPFCIDIFFLNTPIMNLTNAMKPVVAKAGIIQKYTSEEAMMGSKANNKRDSMYPTFSQKSILNGQKMRGHSK
jgi:hypothetical protein